MALVLSRSAPEHRHGKLQICFFKGCIYKARMLSTGNSASLSGRKPQVSVHSMQPHPPHHPTSTSSYPKRHLEGEIYGRIEVSRLPFRAAPSENEFVHRTISAALLCCSEPWVMDGVGCTADSLLKSRLLSMEIYVLPFSMPTSYLPKRISFWKHTNRVNRVRDRVCSLSTVLPFILMIQKFPLLKKKKKSHI